MAPSSTVEGVSRPTRRRYSPEFRQHAINRVFEVIDARDGVRFGVIPEIARQLDVSPSSLRSWVRRAESSATSGRVGAKRQHPAVRPPPAPRPSRDQTTERTAPERGTRVRTTVAALRVPLGLFLAARIVVLAALIVAAHQPHAGLVHLRHPAPWPAPPRAGHLLTTLATWDAAWYVRLAGHSYNPAHLPFTTFNKDVAFFPLFPLLIRGAMLLTGIGAIGGGVLVGFVTDVLATVAVWWAARQLVGEHAANQVVAVWCFFPGAFVFTLVYSEGLTIACAATCLVCLVRGRWVTAGLAAAAATATQPAALVLVPCCLWQALAALRARRDWTALAAPLMAPLGAVAYFAYLWAHTGTPAAWFVVERTFWAHRKLGPWWTVVRPIANVFQHPAAVDDAIRVAGLGFVILATWLLWRWRPPAVFTIWGAGTIVMALMSAPVGTRPRFLLTAFPLVFAVARRLPKSLTYAVVALEAPLLGLLTFVMVTSLRTVP